MTEKITPLSCLENEPYRSILIILSAFPEGLELKHFRYLLLENPGFSRLKFEKITKPTLKKQLEKKLFSFKHYIKKSSKKTSYLQDCITRMKQAYIIEKINDKYKIHPNFYNNNFPLSQRVKENILEMYNCYPPNQSKSYLYRDKKQYLDHIEFVMGIPWDYIDKDAISEKISKIHRLCDEIEELKLSSIQEFWIKKLKWFNDGNKVSDNLKRALVNHPFDGAFYSIEFPLLNAIRKANNRDKKTNIQDWSFAQSVQNDINVRLKFYEFHNIPMKLTKSEFNKLKKPERKIINDYNKKAKKFWDAETKKKISMWSKRWLKVDNELSYDDIKSFVEWGWKQVSFIEKTHPLSIAFGRAGLLRSITGVPLQSQYCLSLRLPEKMLEKLGGDEGFESFNEEGY